MEEDSRLTVFEPANDVAKDASRLINGEQRFAVLGAPLDFAAFTILEHWEGRCQRSPDTLDFTGERRTHEYLFRRRRINHLAQPDDVGMPALFQDGNLPLQPTIPSAPSSDPPRAARARTHFAFAKLDGGGCPGSPPREPIILRIAGSLRFGCLSTILIAHRLPAAPPTGAAALISSLIVPPDALWLREWPPWVNPPATLAARDDSGELMSWPRRTWPCCPRPISLRMTYWLIILRPESSRANCRSAVSRLRHAH